MPRKPTLLGPFLFWMEANFFLSNSVKKATDINTIITATNEIITMEEKCIKFKTAMKVSEYKQQ
jgi:hypothetical protein